MSAHPWPAGSWRAELADAFTDLEELLRALGLDPASVGDLEAAARASRQFGLRVPRGFVSRMRPGDPEDPLLRQVLLDAREADEVEGFSVDPVGELSSPPSGGVLQKYAGRALLMTTGACAVHCRYCFRRHFPYGDHASVAALGTAAARIAADPSVEEVILSGGDPLTLPDELLSELAWLLGQVPHLRRLRIHTRVPVVLPSRVDEALVEWLAADGPARVVVVHVNHPAEIDGDVPRAFEALRAAGVTLLNQSVLLRGVNDSVEALAELSRRLFDAGVLPYYLHLLDRVAGAAHFEVAEEDAVRLLADVRAALPGYLVPRLVREVTGAPAKIPVV